MYTVFRATKKVFSFPLVEKIGAEMNELKSGIYKGLRKAGDGFACEITESTLWDEHVQDIIDFLFLFKNQIMELEQNDYNMAVDVAIESMDFCDSGVGLFLFHNKDFLKALELSKVNYEISIYGRLVDREMA